MKLFVLHLSDIHIKDNNSINKTNIDAIINAIRNSFDGATNAFVIVSGDVSYSGQKTQMIQFANFLKKLKFELKSAHSFDSIEILFVPGNHDVDYSLGKLSRNDLEKIQKENNYENFLLKEIEKQKEFYICANRFGCFMDNNVIDQKEYRLNEKIIRVNLINTAVFSSLEEDQGFHYLPLNEIEKLNNQGCSDFVISVMHHPPQWFVWNVQNKLERNLYDRSDLIFAGHKHFESIKNVIDKESSVNIFAGGMLSNCGDWSNSEFHSAVLDLDSRDISIRKYKWNKEGKIYVEAEKYPGKLSKDRFDKLGFSVKKEFINERIRKDKYMISDSFQDYYVFPLLEEEPLEDKFSGKIGTINSMEEFIDRISVVKKMVIMGRNESGKTVLAKSIFLRLIESKTVIFVDGADVHGNYDRVIKSAFEDIYGVDVIKYETFKQAKTEELAVIIDNVDAVNDSYRESFSDYINNKFGIIVETCQQEIELDIKNRLKKKRANRDFAIYKIAPFYINKRRELVTKILDLIHLGPEETKIEIIATLCDALSRQKILYNWSPDFIVQFTRYYYNNIGDASQNDGNVFSKVFEANIASLLKPCAKKITVDKTFFVLDKIAYDAFVKKEYPITTRLVCRIIEEYNREYDAKIDERDFLNMLIQSRIIKPVEGGYYFFERTFFSYFVAREIRRRCIDDGDYEQFNYAIEYAYKSLNADILLFVTYIADNQSFIKKIMECAEQSVSEWDSFSLMPIGITYLTAPARDIIRPVEEGDREKEEEKRVKAEKEESQSLSLTNDYSIFDGESDELSFMQKMIRAISLMTILSRTLPNFEHLMKKEDKEKCVALIYFMPLKIFNVWAREIDDNRSELVHEIKDFHAWEYRDDMEYEPLTDEKALYYLIWESMSLLLELMNVSITNSTRDNTWTYLDKFNYKRDATLGIEHLIGLGKRNHTELFIKEAETLFKSIHSNFGKTMVKRVAHKYMVTARNIKHSDIQKLNSKLFNQQLKTSRLLVEKDKNKNNR